MHFQQLISYYCDDTLVHCIQVDVLDVDLNFVIEADLHLLSVIVIQLGTAPPQYVYVVVLSMSLICFLPF